MSTILSLINRSFFSVSREEWRRCGPLLLMIALVTFVSESLANVKDAIVITSAGAEAIPFIKFWGVLPAAVGMAFVLTRLTNRFGQERAFYIVVSTFLLLFGTFAFLVYPLHQWLHPLGWAKNLEASSAVGFRGLLAMLHHWTFTLFYVTCELWNGIVYSVLFWGVANAITKSTEASRFYSLLAVGANIAAILAGRCAIWISRAGGSWEQTLMLIIASVILCGVGCMAVFSWMNRHVIEESLDTMLSTSSSVKPKMTLRESWQHLMNSKYLLCMAVMVLAYNMITSMVEVVWKDQVRVLYPTPGEYNNFMSHLTSTIGIASTLAALSMASIIRRWGWTVAAMITPVTMLVTCAGFFFFYFSQGHLDSQVQGLLGALPLTVAVFFGAAQFCLGKVTNSFFYPTKEMAFVPLPAELKLKGKIIIDGIGSRVGKSGGSLIHSGCLIACGTVVSSAPYVATIVIAVNICWLICTRQLGQQYGETSDKVSVASP